MIALGVFSISFSSFWPRLLPHRYRCAWQRMWTVQIAPKSKTARSARKITPYRFETQYADRLIFNNIDFMMLKVYHIQKLAFFPFEWKSKYKDKNSKVWRLWKISEDLALVKFFLISTNLKFNSFYESKHVYQTSRKHHSPP